MSIFGVSPSSSSSVVVSPSQIASQMVAAMGVAEPTLDLSVGTTMRKMIDVIAEQVAQAYYNLPIGNEASDVTNMSGATLDAYVAQFGFVRFPAVPATGLVTFTQATSQSSNANQTVVVPAGAQVSTLGSPPVIFSVLATSAMAPTDTTLTVPVAAVIGGSAGNVGIGAITATTTNLPGIASVTNSQPITGGADAESDAALIARFQATIFRSLAGTSEMFEGTALEVLSVTAANLIGSAVTHSEQIEMPSDGSAAISSVADAAFVYPSNSFMATDLSAAVSTVETGTFALASAVNSGETVSVLISSTQVSLPTGALMTVGSTVVTVASAVSDSTSIPVVPFTPASTYAIGYVVNYLVSSGSFLVAGQDFIVSTAPLLDTPAAPTATAGAAAVGFEVSATYGYAVAFGNGYGQTPASAVTSVAVAGTSTAPEAVTVSWALPTDQTQLQAVTQVYIYGRTPTSVTLLTVLPASDLEWIDTGALVPDYPPQTTNTTGVLVQVQGVSANVVPGSLYQLQFDYLPLASRNDYAAGVLNRVDVYVAGEDPTTAAEAVAFYVGPLTYGATTNGTFSSQFSASSLSQMYVGGFQRLDGTYPDSGNIFLPLSYVPLMSLPSTIISPATPAGPAVTYNYEESFWGVNRIGAEGMSDLSLAGIEWSLNAPFGLAFPTSTADTTSLASVSVSYVFNDTIAQVDQGIARWSLLSQDVMVHQATAVPLNFYLMVVLQAGVTAGSVQTSVTTAIQGLLSSVSFNDFLEPSTVIAAVQAVGGVRAVRFMRSSDVGVNVPIWSSRPTYAQGTVVTDGTAGHAWSAIVSNLDQPLPAAGVSDATWAWAGNAYAIAPVSPTGVVTAPYAVGGDVVAVSFSDTTYPTFNGVFLTPTAQNLFGSG